MKKARFSEEQIVGILKQHEAGMKTAELCRQHNISAATFYPWKAKYGGLEVNEAQELKRLGYQTPFEFAGTLPFALSILNTTDHSRPQGCPDRAPMCGLDPVRSAQGNL